MIEELKKYADKCELILISTMNRGDYVSYATDKEKNMIQFIEK